MKGFRIILILAITTVLGCSGKNKSSKSRNFEIKTPEFDEVLVEIEATVNEIKYDEILNYKIYLDECHVNSPCNCHANNMHLLKVTA